MNESEPASVRGLQGLQSVDQRSAGRTGAEGRGGERHEGGAVLGDRIGNRQLMHVVGGLPAIDGADVGNVLRGRVVA